MRLEILYLEDSKDAQNSFLKFLDKRHDVDLVTSITAFDERLYDWGGFDDYDLLAIDLHIDMPSTTLENLKSKIPEFNNDYEPTVVNDSTLHGLDYFNRVVATRNDTETFISERRVVLISGNAIRVERRGLIEPELLKKVVLINRGDPDWTIKFQKVIDEVQKRKT